MKQDIEEEILIKNYLLGNLRQEEQLRVEERLFFDPEYFQILQVVEDDLIDDYLYEELSPNEREKFDSYFLSTPERHESLRIAKALKSYISASSVSVTPAVANDARRGFLSKPSLLLSLRLQNLSWKLPIAIATLLVLAGVLWLLIIAIRTPDRISPVQEAQQSPPPSRNLSSPHQEDVHQAGNINLGVEPQPDQTAEQKNRKPSNREVAQKKKGPPNDRGPGEQVYPTNSQSRESAEPTYLALLTPGGPTRGGGGLNELTPPINVGVITLQLPLVEDVGYSNYQVILSSDDNRVRRRWKGQSITDQRAGKIVSINVPAQLLGQQSYRVKLIGFSPNGDAKEIQTFYFRVAER